MTSPNAVHAEPRAEPTRRRSALAMAMQEALTIAVRLRANRQTAADPESFRRQLRQVLALGEEEAQRAGYGPGETKRAIYAATVFLDESVLNSGQPMFADWASRPLQEEIFGGHLGGEVFFRNLAELMARSDTEELADLLEVHLLCLLLGFKGRFAMDDSGQLRVLSAQVVEKIDRIRGGATPLAPQWALLAGETLPSTRDPWLRRLLVSALVASVLAAVLWGGFHFALRTEVDRIAALQRVLQ